jgi:hypothetical protein
MLSYAISQAIHTLYKSHTFAFLTSNPPTMAYSAVEAAVAGVVAQAVFDAKKSVIDAFKAFMAEKIEMDEDMEAYFDEFKSSLVMDEVAVASAKVTKRTKGKSEPAKKREPSAYNLWIKAKMAELKATREDLKGRALMAAAVAEWRLLEDKPKSTKATKAPKLEVIEETEESVESVEEVTVDEPIEEEVEEVKVEEKKSKSKAKGAKGSKKTKKTVAEEESDA